MTTHPQTGWRCAARPPQPRLLQLLALLLMLTWLHPGLASAVNKISTNAWLSGPAELWETIIGNSTTEALIKLAASVDLQTAIQILDSNAKVNVTNLTSYKDVINGPSYGANAAFDVITEKLSEDELLLAVLGAVMASTDEIFSAVGMLIPITALLGKGPFNMTSVGVELLPVIGSTYFWTVVLDTLNKINELAVVLLMYPLQIDLQDTVDLNMSKFLIEATPSKIVVNASSVYLAYTVWAFPGSEVGSGTSDDLKALAMTSELPQFNVYWNTLKSLYPDLQAYLDLFPTDVRPWTPPPGNPFEEESDDSDGPFPVLSNNTGDYFLLFSGKVERWGVVLETKRETVFASIEKAIETKLHRRTFVNTAHVDSAETVPDDDKQSGGLRVRCRVVQGLTSFSNHTWSPEEVASLLFQADYGETQALYASSGSEVEGDVQMRPSAAVIQPTLSAVAHGSSPGSIVTATISYNYSTEMSKEMAGIIVMAALIVGASLIIIIFTVLCCCLCPNLTRPRSKPKRSSPPSVGSDM